MTSTRSRVRGGGPPVSPATAARPSAPSSDGSRRPRLMVPGLLHRVDGVDNRIRHVTVSTGPTVTGVTPSSGSVSGGTTVTVSGTGFTSGTTVKFGATAATGVTISCTSLTAVSPAATGAPRQCHRHHVGGHQYHQFGRPVHVRVHGRCFRRCPYLSHVRRCQPGCAWRNRGHGDRRGRCQPRHWGLHPVGH